MPLTVIKIPSWCWKENRHWLVCRGVQGKGGGTKELCSSCLGSQSAGGDGSMGQIWFGYSSPKHGTHNHSSSGGHDAEPHHNLSLHCPKHLLSMWLRDISARNRKLKDHAWNYMGKAVLPETFQVPFLASFHWRHLWFFSECSFKLHLIR